MYKEDTVYYPQDEMNTLLIPVTSGCPYNRCKFCSMYKDGRYFEIPLLDIEMQLMNGDIYTEKVFLTGADPIFIGFDKMKKVLEMIRKYLPYCACVASYASVRSISKYSVEELSYLHNEGLRLLYIGFETGRDDILKLMHKSHKVEDAIKQAKKLNEARIPFNSIIMYGIAGKGESAKNAAATAKMINKFITNKLITMNLIVMEGAELNNMVKKGEFIPPERRERLEEIKILLENLEPKNEMMFDTTHPTNIIKIEGVIPRDRMKLIKEVERQIRNLG